MNKQLWISGPEGGCTNWTAFHGQLEGEPDLHREDSPTSRGKLGKFPGKGSSACFWPAACSLACSIVRFLTGPPIPLKVGHAFGAEGSIPTAGLEVSELLDRPDLDRDIGKPFDGGGGGLLGAEIRGRDD